jgi:hypothetical protein
MPPMPLTAHEPCSVENTRHIRPSTLLRWMDSAGSSPVAKPPAAAMCRGLPMLLCSVFRLEPKGVDVTYDTYKTATGCAKWRSSDSRVERSNTASPLPVSGRGVKERVTDWEGGGGLSALH